MRRNIDCKKGNTLHALIVYGRALDENNKQLYSACKNHFEKVTLAKIMDMSAYIDSNRSLFWLADEQLPKIDLCFLRSFGPGSCEQVTKRISMMEHLEVAGALVANSTYAYRKAKDKYSMTYTLAKEGLPIPRTYVTEMAHWAYRASREFQQIVYKPIVGSLGFGSMKFDSVDLAFNAYKTIERWGQPMYVQEYLNKSGRDIRAMVLGESVLAAISREAQPGEWKANIAQQAKATAIQLTPELEELAIKAAKAMSLLYSGVDILETSDGPVILEVNASPSWQGLRQATQIEVAEKLVEFICNYIRR